MRSWPQRVTPRGDDIIEISAKTGKGIDALISKIEKTLQKTKKRAVLRLPYEKGGLLEILHREASVLRLEYLDDGIEVEAVLDLRTYGRVRDYVSTEN